MKIENGRIIISRGKLQPNFEIKGIEKFRLRLERISHNEIVYITNFNIKEAKETKKLMRKGIKNKPILHVKSMDNKLIFLFNKNKELNQYEGCEVDVKRKGEILELIIRGFVEKREVTTILKNRILKILRIAPESFKLNINGKEYAAIKAFNIEHEKTNHGFEDVIITFNQKHVSYLNSGKNSFSRVFKRDGPWNRTVIFLTSNEYEGKNAQKEVYVKLREDDGKTLSILLDEDDYEEYLLEYEVAKRKLEELKRTKHQLRSQYYNYVKGYVVVKKPLMDYRIKKVKQKLEDLNINEFDFSRDKIKIKRTLLERVKVFFMKNNEEILITNDLDLKINLNWNLIEREIDIPLEKGRKMALKEAKFMKKNFPDVRTNITEEEERELKNYHEKITLISKNLISPETCKHYYMNLWMYDIFRKKLHLLYKNLDEIVIRKLNVPISIYTAIWSVNPSHLALMDISVFMPEELQITNAFTIDDFRRLISISEYILRYLYSLLWVRIFINDLGDVLDWEKRNLLEKLSMFLIKFHLNIMRRPLKLLAGASLIAVLLSTNLNNKKDIINRVYEKLNIDGIYLRNRVLDFTLKSPILPYKSKLNPQDYEIGNKRTMEKIAMKLIELILINYGRTIKVKIDQKRLEDMKRVVEEMIEIFNALCKLGVIRKSEKLKDAISFFEKIYRENVISLIKKEQCEKINKLLNLIRKES
ncbi:MAG: hypothetical protein ACTSRH_05015 [Promethearchaeota archaeon]